MSSELLYTSAPKGLRQGSRGFCTVISSSGMPSNLATKLESLSGYRQMFAPESPEANQNPVAYSHMTMTIGGQGTSVLSRICAYGTDYSGRTNKLAHHVVPTRSEMPPAGPAWLLQQPGLMRTQWDGNCQTTAAGPAISMGNLTAGKCNTWQQLAGDAAWAAALAAAWSQRQSKPLWIIYRLEQSHQLLSLLSEAIALLPENERWKATFNTYATQLPPDVQCRVRCVVEGTQDARMAKARGTVITLGQANGSAPTNAWSEIARGNQPPAPSPQLSPTQPTTHQATPSTKKSSPAIASKLPGLPPANMPAKPSAPAMPVSAATPATNHTDGSVELPAMRPPKAVNSAGYPAASPALELIDDGNPPVAPYQPGPKRSKAPLIAAAAVVIFLLLGAGTIAVLKRAEIAASFNEPGEDPSSGDGGSADNDDSDDNGDSDDGGDSDDNTTPAVTSGTSTKPKLTVSLRQEEGGPKKDVTNKFIEEPEENKPTTFCVDVECAGDDPEKVKLSVNSSFLGDERYKLYANGDDEEGRKEVDIELITGGGAEGVVKQSLTLTLTGDKNFNPAMLTFTATPIDGSTEREGTATLLIEDSDDLTIALKHKDKPTTNNIVHEGNSYDIDLPDFENLKREITCSIKSKDGTSPPDFNIETQVFKFIPGKTELKLLETNPTSFPDNFLEISITATYKQGGQTLAKSSKKLQVKDNDPRKDQLRWKDAKVQNSVTKLVKEERPDVAYHPKPTGDPAVFIQTNRWPPAPSFVNVNAGTKLAVGNQTACLFIHYGLNRSDGKVSGKELDRFNKTQADLRKKRNVTLFQSLSVDKAKQNHISKRQRITVTIPKPQNIGKLKAHLFSTEDEAVKFLNPEPQPTPPTEPEQPKERTAYIDENDLTRIYVLIPADGVDQGNKCSTPELRRGDNPSTTQPHSDEPRQTLKSKLSGLPFPDTFDVETQWDAPKVSTFDTDLEQPLKKLTVITLKDYFVIECELFLRKTKRGSEENLGNKLFKMKDCKKELDTYIEFLTKKDMTAPQRQKNTRDLLSELKMDINPQVTSQKTALLQGHAPQQRAHRFLKNGTNMAQIWSSFIGMESANLSKLDFTDFEKSCKKNTVNNSLYERLPTTGTDKDKKFKSDHEFYNFTKKCFEHLKEKADQYDAAKGKIERLDLDLKIEIDKYEPDEKITIPLKFKLKF